MRATSLVMVAVMGVGPSAAGQTLDGNVTISGDITITVNGKTLILGGEKTTTVAKAERRRVIAKAARLMSRRYVFPDQARASAERIQRRLDAGAYDALQSPIDLAEVLTRDLRSSCAGDKHIRVRVAPGVQPGTRTVDRADVRARRPRRRQPGKSGFHRVEVLAGNVGYIEMSYFERIEKGRQAARAALDTVADTEAVIVDLRGNSGGSMTMVSHLAAYFFDRRVHLETTWWRSRQRHEKAYTARHVPGKRMPDVPLYVVLDADSISAAEMFAYCLQAEKRAVIVGETSAGAANACSDFLLDRRFVISIPTGHGVHPVTGTNWEGTGVIPDVSASSKDAVNVAHALALKWLREAQKH